MIIGHITADYPDCLVPSKTRAIANLLELTAARFEHVVFSLNRRSPGLAEFARALVSAPAAPRFAIEGFEPASDTQVISYAAPPKGLFLRSVLERLADWIADQLAQRAVKPDLIHGHKLTVEGIIAREVAVRIGRKYALTIQGNTDQKILSARPDLAPLYRKVFHDAAVVFAFAPWALRFVERRLGRRTGPSICLPVPTHQDRVIAPALAGPKLVTAFHLDNYRLKNIDVLLEASRTLRREFAGYELSVLGGGSREAHERLDRMVRHAGGVRLEGAIRPSDIQRRFNEAAGFALISKRESFGMVFVESLLAGCPVVYPAGRAVDGFFDDCPFAIAASPNDQPAITDAMRRLIRDEAVLKRKLAEWQQSGAAARFRRDSIAECYRHGVELVGAGDKNLADAM